MTLTTDKNSTLTFGLSLAVSEALTSFRRMIVDDKLGLLWVIHQGVACSLTPMAPGAARLFLTQGLLHRIKQMSPTEQMSVIHDLLSGADTPITRQYGMFVPNTKLVFWSQLFEWMCTGEVVTAPTTYQLSATALQLLKKIVSLDYDEQIKFVRIALIDMGVEPITV
jgi:hypothetical protein